MSFSAHESTDPDGLPLAFRWDLGDGLISEYQDIVHNYDSPGYYRVGLTVNNGSLADLDWIDIYVVDENPETGTDGDATLRAYSSDYGETAWFEDDTINKIKGSGSIKMDTESAFPFMIYYPSSKSANWDLSSYDTIRFWIKKSNRSIHGWQGNNPEVRLCTDDSH